MSVSGDAEAVLFHQSRSAISLPSTAHSSLAHVLQTLRHVYRVRAFIVALPCLAEQPALVGGVLEVRTGLLFLDEVHLVIREVRQVLRTV